MAFKQHLSDLWVMMLDLGGWTLVALAVLALLVIATGLVSAFQIAMLHPFSFRSGAAQDLRYHIEQRKSAGASQQQIEESATLAVKGFLRQARTGFRLLELVVTAAPLLGLLGTVLGMIEAFHAMQIQGDTVKPADLAGGIWEALTTTAAGMVIALAALALHAMLDSIVDGMRYRLECVATDALYGTSTERKGRLQFARKKRSGPVKASPQQKPTPQAHPQQKPTPQAQQDPAPSEDDKSSGTE
ncbi:MotA/TolQ/ExbB proton channel family protein [uncultured Cohaesibacter sp.]|uniref:MotA/TolQ/ExbB proton channel family protein n=1 Tax=uncultured Cohaesibacter sp. TaxID=1002546 RepID=UPI00292D7C07|nr:MotA/TolQ/ExbB proton channel family protein [uncultured Cohaesibacter sp.]